MDITTLVPTVHKLFAAGLAPSTKRAYKSGGVRYQKFCADAKLTPFPTSEKVLLLFVGFLHQQQLAHGTIKSYLAAVRYEQIAQGMGNPNISTMPQLEYVLKGLKKATPASSRRRLPITPDILLRLRQVWQQDPKPHNAKMLWAASCLCFFGFLRSGEIVSPSEKTFDPLTHLCFSDVRVDSHSSPSYLQITIKASKTDPFRQGVTLFVGVSGGSLCPVSAVLNYMVARGSSPGPLFTWDDGRYLTRESFVARVRSALSTAGYRGTDYAGHSFRIGAATTASRCGVQDSLIKTLGRWESAAYTRYIRTAPEVLCKVSKTLLQSLVPRT